MNYTKRLAWLTAVLLSAAGIVEPVYGQGQDTQATTVQTKTAALAKSIQTSGTELRRYEWVENAIVSQKGEEKSRKHQPLRTPFAAESGRSHFQPKSSNMDTFISPSKER